MVRGHVQRKWEVKVSAPRISLCPQAFCLTWPKSNILSVLTDTEVIIYATTGKPEVSGGLLGNIEKYRLSLTDFPSVTTTSPAYDFDITESKTLAHDLVQLTRNWMDKKPTANFEEVFMTQVWNYTGNKVIFHTNLNRVFLCILDENTLSFNLSKQLSAIIHHLKPLEDYLPKTSSFFLLNDKEYILISTDIMGILFINNDNLTIEKEYNIGLSEDRKVTSLFQVKSKNRILCGCSDGIILELEVKIDEINNSILIQEQNRINLNTEIPIYHFKQISQEEIALVSGNGCFFIDLQSFSIKNKIFLDGVITGIDTFTVNNNTSLDGQNLLSVTTSSGDISFISLTEYFLLDNSQVLAQDEVTNLSEEWRNITESDVYLEDFSKAQLPLHGLIISPNQKLLFVLNSQYDPLEIKKNRIFTPKLFLRILCLKCSLNNNTVGTYSILDNSYPFDILYHLQITRNQIIVDDLEDMKKFPELLMIASKLSLEKRIFPQVIINNLTLIIQNHIIDLYLTLTENKIKDEDETLGIIYHLTNDFIACWEEKGDEVLLKHEQYSYITTQRKKYQRKHFKPVLSNLPFRETFGECSEPNTQIVTDHLQTSYANILQGVVKIDNQTLRVSRCPMTLLVIQGEPFVYCPFCGTSYNNWEKIEIFADRKRTCLLCQTKLEKLKPVPVTTVPPSNETLDFDS